MGHGRGDDGQPGAGSTEHGAAHGNPESVIHHSRTREVSTRAWRSANGVARWACGLHGEPWGDAYDNAMAESFFATLECELLDRRSWRTKAEARTALFTWIELVQPAAAALLAGVLLTDEIRREVRREQRSRHRAHGLPTAAVGSSQAPTAAVDNPAPVNA